MIPRLPHLVALGLAATAAPACAGYADLPLPLRELGALDVELAALAPGGPTRVQLALELPADATGPAVLVGHPAADAYAGARVVAWAWGPCPDGPAPDDARPRLCVALEVSEEATDDAFTLTAVAETRGDGRRFTLVGAVPLDRTDAVPALTRRSGL